MTKQNDYCIIHSHVNSVRTYMLMQKYNKNATTKPDYNGKKSTTNAILCENAHSARAQYIEKKLIQKLIINS